jgi:hypothetical protein
VGTLSPKVDLSQAKFAKPPLSVGYTAEEILFKYEEAAWLLGQISTNKGQIGEIQFAIWRIFTPGTTIGLSSRNVPIENYWMDQASNINVTKFDFSSVRIYTPTDSTNQEFMSGAAVHAPIPPSLLLLAPGLIGLVGVRRRMR